MKRGSITRKSSKILLILTCHDKYIPKLKRCIRSINDNSKFTNYLLLDNCTCQVDSSRWKVETVYGDPGPNKLRNRGIQIAIEGGYDWLVYFDADNIMPANFGSLVEVKTNNAKKNIGVIFNDTPLLEAKKQFDLTEANFVDTCSAWRVSALQQSGGWDEKIGGYDDWQLALRVKALGYKFINLEIPVQRFRHEDNRGTKTAHLEALPQARSLGAFTLFSGNKSIFKEFREYILAERWPQQTHFYWIDNSNDDKFFNLLYKLTYSVSKLGYSVTLIRDRTKCVWKNPGDKARHDHVCGLYNRHIGNVTENLLLFHEDDVIPEIGAYERIVRQVYPKSKTAGVGASYRSRTNPSLACASTDDKVWRNNPRFDEVDKTIKVGMMGGGFTVYINFLVQKALPLRCDRNEMGGMQGWDGNLGKTLYEYGYCLLLDCKEKCFHRTPEVKKFLRRNKLIK